MLGLSDTSMGILASVLLHVGVAAACFGVWGPGQGHGGRVGVVSVDLLPAEVAPSTSEEAKPEESLPVPPSDPKDGVIKAQSAPIRPARAASRATTQRPPRTPPAHVVDSPTANIPQQGGGGLFGALFSPPVAVTIPTPDYPSSARRQGLEGVVIVMVQVEADGAVSQAHVLTSSGSEALDAAVLKSVRKATFRPASRGGLPVAAQKKISVRFDLTE